MMWNTNSCNISHHSTIPRFTKRAAILQSLPYKGMFLHFIQTNTLAGLFAKHFTDQIAALWTQMVREKRFLITDLLVR